MYKFGQKYKFFVYYTIKNNVKMLEYGFEKSGWLYGGIFFNYTMLIHNITWKKSFFIRSYIVYLSLSYER